MNKDQIINIYEQSGALLRGHFILSSGLHSDIYMQSAKVLSNPANAEKLCIALAELVENKFGKDAFDMVFSPAMGGVIVGYEMARQLGLPAIFCERVNGVFELRRGFEIAKGARILIVEDVFTTGKSSLEAIVCAKANGGNVIGEAALVDRSSGKSADFAVPFVSLLQIEAKTFDEHNIPEELKNIPAIKPGSRFLQQN